MRPDACPFDKDSYKLYKYILTEEPKTKAAMYNFIHKKRREAGRTRLTNNQISDQFDLSLACLVDHGLAVRTDDKPPKFYKIIVSEETKAVDHSDFPNAVPKH